MSFARTESQTLLADMLTRLLTAENEFESRRRRLSGATPDRKHLWPQFAEQGILGAALPEEAGGFGGAMRDLAVVMQQAGASLVVEPLLSSAIAARILHAAGADLTPLISGERITIFAHTEGFDPFSPPATLAEKHGDSFALTGAKTIIRQADIADDFIVSASLNGKPALFLASTPADPIRLLDASGAANLNFAATPATYLADASVLADALLWSLTGLAAEITGIVDALNKATFAYLGARKQFGVPLAAFQALQHRAANMYAAAEEIRALTSQAIDAIDQSTPSAPALASAAKSLADDRARLIGHEAVQLHGGMGVSDELDVSHYMRRLATIRAEFGSIAIHRARFAALTESPHAA